MDGREMKFMREQKEKRGEVNEREQKRKGNGMNQRCAIDGKQINGIRITAKKARLLI